jgi:NADH-quinone oxidoreductase subunit G
MGATGRGEDMEITTYLESALTSELQGNLVDICPVGALTSKPYAFAARPWELGKTQSIDVMDGVGSAIRVDTRGREVMRILPRVNEAVNEEWISDKTRHIVDGLRTQRLDRPYIRENGQLRAASWSEAFGAIAAKAGRIDGKRIGAIAGDLAAVEEMFALKELLAKCGSANLAVQGGDAFDPKAGRASYIFNPTIAGIEQADALADRGLEPAQGGRRSQRAHPQALAQRPAQDRRDRRQGRPHLRLRLSRRGHGLAQRSRRRQAFLRGRAEGREKSDRAGRRRCGGAARRSGGSGACGQAGAGFRRDQGRLERIRVSARHRLARRRARYRLCRGRRRPERGADDDVRHLDVLFLLGADEIKVPDGTFVVYIGTHGDRGAHRADVILPGAAYTEKSGIYVNTEGRVQMANRAAFPRERRARTGRSFVRCRTFWARSCLTIRCALRQAIFKAAPHLMRVDQIEAGNAADLKTLAGKGGTVEKAPFKTSVEDFYLTNPIARASAVMAECSRLASGQMLTAAE